MTSGRAGVWVPWAHITLDSIGTKMHPANGCQLSSISGGSYPWIMILQESAHDHKIKVSKTNLSCPGFSWRMGRGLLVTMASDKPLSKNGEQLSPSWGSCKPGDVLYWGHRGGIIICPKWWGICPGKWPHLPFSFKVLPNCPWFELSNCQFIPGKHHA